MQENDGKVVLPFTLQNPSHPTTPKQTIWYEFLKRCHCHCCPESIDCDVEEFLNCQIPLNVKFNKCTCYLCIDEKKLRKIIQSYQKTPQPKKRRYEELDYYEETLLETNI